MKKVSIVGAGLVGSLLAAYLGKRGYKVDVYETRPDMRQVKLSAGKSINMACSYRGWEALDYIGVGDRVRKEAIAMYGRTMHDTNGNLSYQPYGVDDQAIFSISRGGLNKILMTFAEELDNVDFHYNHKCVDVDLDNASVTFSVDGVEKKTEADFVFGADGVFSAVRYKGMQKSDRFNFAQTYSHCSYKELEIPAGENGSFLIEKNALHIWPRGPLMLIALPNPDGSFTCTLFMPYEGEESFTALDTDEKVEAFFKKQFPDAVELMPNLIDVYNQNATSDLCYVTAYPWSHSDKVCLIGDASHGIVPFYGQGMISGFEDCTVLNQLLDSMGDGDLEAVFKAFEKSRKPNTDAILEMALQNHVEMSDLVGDPNFLLRKRIEKRLYQLHPDKFVPLYSMASFSNVPYAEALAKGKEQELILDKVAERSNIEAVLDTAEFEHIAKEVLGLA